jgi:hypothetical protein
LTAVASALLAALALLSAPARAGKPWPRTFTCCVIDGFLLNVEGGQLFPQASGGGRFDPQPFEGKRVRVDGDLNPGDRFVVKPPVVTLGDCDRAQRDKLTGALGFAYRNRAKYQMGNKAWREALVSINRAMSLVPGRCSFRMTRAEVHEGLGDLKSALTDAKQAVKDGCTDRWDAEIYERISRKQ